MESILIAVVWIIIITKVINKFLGDDSDKKNNNENREKRPVKRAETLKKEWVPAWEREEKPLKLEKEKLESKDEFSKDIDNSQEDIKNIVENSKIIIKDSNRAFKKKKADENSRREKNVKREPSRVFSLDELDRKDIIRGMVFKEILDSPRAYKPYYSILKERYRKK